MKQSEQYDDLTAIYLARHCTTRWNKEGRIQGSNDLPLCDAGRAQAAAVAPTLARHGFDTIVSSPYRRALQTAAIYAEHLQISVQVHDGLKELNHGAWEGEVIDTLLSDQYSGYAQWLEDALSVRIPGGEDIAAAQRRISDAISEIVLQHPRQRVMVITHKHIRAVLSCRLRNLSLSKFGQAIEERVKPVEITTKELRRLSRINP